MTVLDTTCENTIVGYQGCFNSEVLPVALSAVNSIEECVKHCALKYNYAGIMNG